MTVDVPDAQFLERASTLTTLVPAWLDGFALPTIDLSAVCATPSKSRQGQHFFLQLMVGGDGDVARTIHLRHLPEKIPSVVRPPFQHIELPLVDHLMGEGIQQLLFRVGRPCCEPLQQGLGQANFPTAAAPGRWRYSWTATADEHAD
jgi:hypothetical protein